MKKLNASYTFESIPGTKPEPSPRCSICNGSGYYLIGDADEPTKCSCRKRIEHNRLIERLMGESGLVPGKTFQSFRLTGNDGAHSPDGAYHDALDYAQGVSDHPWLLFYGPYGTGKTHLALAIGNYAVLESAAPTVFGVVPDLIDNLRGGFRDGTYDSLLATLKRVDLLILDDFGIGKQSPDTWEYRTLFQVLNHRSMRELRTVITTNLKTSQIEPRMASRLMDQRLCQAIHIDAPDARRAALIGDKR